VPEGGGPLPGTDELEIIFAADSVDPVWGAEIQRTGFRAAIAQDDRLDFIYGDTGQPTAIHFLYSHELDPVLVEWRESMRARG
jgi:hypothetical protein